MGNGLNSAAATACFGGGPMALQGLGATCKWGRLCMGTMPASKQTRTLFVAAVLVLATCLSAHWIFLGDRLRWPIDFQVFWSSGRRPLDEVYADHGMPFVYPPASLFLFKPFSLMPFLPSYLVWLALSTALFGLAVARTSGAKVSALSFLSPAAAKGVTLGQSAMLLGGALFAALRLPPVARGAVFGLVATIKPQLVVFAPIAFAVRREWSTLVGMVGAWVLVLLASMVAFGPLMWADWLRALPHFHDLVMQFNVVSFAISPAARAEYFGLPALPFIVAGAAIGLAAVVTMSSRAEDEMLVALIVGASLAASPYAHAHDSIALIPACIVLLQRAGWPLAIAAALVITGTAAWTPVGLVAGLMLAALWGFRRRPSAAGKIDESIVAP